MAVYHCCRQNLQQSCLEIVLASFTTASDAGEQYILHRPAGLNLCDLLQAGVRMHMAVKAFRLKGTAIRLIQTAWSKHVAAQQVLTESQHVRRPVEALSTGGT